MLVAALLELKARGLFPDEDAELSELEPEEAAEELARRLAEYRRAKEAAAWLAERLEAEGDRFFRLGPAPLAPRVERRLAPQEPESLAAALRAARGGAAVGLSWRTSSCASRRCRSSSIAFAPCCGAAAASTSTRRWPGCSRIEQAVAFLALLELRRAGEVALEQAAPFAPIRVQRAEPPKRGVRNGPPAPPDHREPGRPARADRRGAARRRLAAAVGRGAGEAADDDAERIETALRLLAERYRRGPQRDRARARRRRLGVSRVARGGRGVRAAVRAAGGARALGGGSRDAGDRRLPRAGAAARRSRASAASPPTRWSPGWSSAA